MKYRINLDGSLLDEEGRVIAPSQLLSPARPMGPWDANRTLRCVWCNLAVNDPRAELPCAAIGHYWHTFE